MTPLAYCAEGLNFSTFINEVITCQKGVDQTAKLVIHLIQFIFSPFAVLVVNYCYSYRLFPLTSRPQHCKNLISLRRKGSSSRNYRDDFGKMTLDRPAMSAILWYNLQKKFKVTGRSISC